MNLVRRISCFQMYSPPFVDSDVRRPCEPRVDDEDASEGHGRIQTFLQRRVVVKSETFPEPMDGVLVFVSHFNFLKSITAMDILFIRRVLKLLI